MFPNIAADGQKHNKLTKSGKKEQLGMVKAVLKHSNTIFV